MNRKLLFFFCFFILSLVPLFAPSYNWSHLIVKVVVFALLAAGYDLQLGYTGVISFAHSVFFGIGGYSFAILSLRYPESPGLVLALAMLATLVICSLLSLCLSLTSLRIQKMYFTMFTVALGEFVVLLAGEADYLTGGDDGLNFPGFTFFREDFILIGGLTGQDLLFTMIVLITGFLIFTLVLVTESPLGQVLVAIRQNEKRTEAFGISSFYFRSFASLLGSVMAGMAGILWACWLGYVSPHSIMGIPLMMTILLIVIIGGSGTIYGSVIGSALLLSVEFLLPKAKEWLPLEVDTTSWTYLIFDRWLLVLGLIYILIVFFFPKGILGLWAREPVSE